MGEVHCRPTYFLKKHSFKNLGLCTETVSFSTAFSWSPWNNLVIRMRRKNSYGTAQFVYEGRRVYTIHPLWLLSRHALHIGSICSPKVFAWMDLNVLNQIYGRKLSRLVYIWNVAVCLSSFSTKLISIWIPLTLLAGTFTLKLESAVRFVVAVAKVLEEAIFRGAAYSLMSAYWIWGLYCAVYYILLDITDATSYFVHLMDAEFMSSLSNISDQRISTSKLCVLSWCSTTFSAAQQPYEWSQVS